MAIDKGGPSSASAQTKTAGYQVQPGRFKLTRNLSRSGLDGQRIVHVTDAGRGEHQEIARWRSFGESTWRGVDDAVAVYGESDVVLVLEPRPIWISSLSCAWMLPESRLSNIEYDDARHAR